MIKLFLPFFLLCSSAGFAATQENYAAPSQLPNVKRQMLSAGFWIARHPSVDKIVMSNEQIDAFNTHIQNDLKLTKDIFTLIENFKTESLLDVLKKDLADFTDKGYYTPDGLRNDSAFMDKIKNNMRLSGVVSGVAPRYGLIVRLADQRFLPTSNGLYAQRGDIDFDELQNSALDIGTPVAIVHHSLDRKWLYVISELSDGWVKAENIAVAPDKQVKAFEQAESFIVITSPKADLFLDEAMTDFYDSLRMGVRLPVIDENEQQWVVSLPLRDEKQGELLLTKAYIPKFQAHRGYLPYTARAIYTQAFAMLDKPYGWGDMYGAQDCSRFLQMVYATVGIRLPRDSKNQAQISGPLASFEEKGSEALKLEALSKALGALSILPLKGHIMLYLGMDNHIPYAIHETTGYSQTHDDRQLKYMLNRVIVSDLSLGEDSSKGSLLKRLIKIVGVYADEN